MWDDEEASTTDCGGSGAIAISRCCEVGDAFAANDESAWGSCSAVVSVICREVTCVGSLLILEDRMGARVAVSGSDDETAGVCFPLGLLPLAYRKYS